MVLVRECLQRFLIVDVIEENVPTRSESVNKIGFTGGQLASTRTSSKQSLLHIIWEQFIQQLGASARLGVHGSDECLSLQLQVQSRLDFQQTATFRNEDVQKVLIQLGESNFLGAKDAGYKGGQVGLAKDIKLGGIGDLDIGRLEERAFDGVDTLGVIEQGAHSRIRLAVLRIGLGHHRGKVLVGVLGQERKNLGGLKRGVKSVDEAIDMSERAHTRLSKMGKL